MFSIGWRVLALCVLLGLWVPGAVAEQTADDGAKKAAGKAGNGLMNGDQIVVALEKQGYTGIRDVAAADGMFQAVGVNAEGETVKIVVNALTGAVVSAAPL
jgi:hypothetical protein